MPPTNVKYFFHWFIVYVSVFVCWCMYRVQRVISIFSLVAPIYFLREGLLLNLELASFAGLASQLALEDPLSLLLEHWVLPDFYVCSEESKLRFSHLAPKVLLPGPSLYPTPCFYEISYMLKF